MRVVSGCVAACLGLCLFLSGLGSAGAADDARLVYSETGYVVLDPARVRTPNDQRLVLALFDGLTAVDGGSGKIVPAAASRWTEAPDRLSWTFHLRPGGTWSDGSPVRAEDFVEAWKRLLDPYEMSCWSHLLRPLRGGAAVSDGDRGMRVLGAAMTGLKELLAEHAPAGIPGRALGELIERSGVRRYAGKIDDPAVSKMLRWGEDAFPRERAEAARKALRKARGAYKEAIDEAFRAFGKTNGVKAKDASTLVVLLDRPCPWLPEVVARAPLVPLHTLTRSGSETAFDPGEIVTNGAYRLHGRGAKARPGLMSPDSVVHLKRSDDYRGPRPGVIGEILCFTDQGDEEDMRRLGVGDLDWMPNPVLKHRKRLKETEGFVTRPSGRLVVLRFRADRPPFDDVKVRRAFALAIDRTRVTRQIWPAPDEAWRLVPWAGSRAGPRAPACDKDAGRALLAEAGVGGDDFPWVELQVAEMGRLYEAGEALLKLWEKGLGVEVGIRLETRDDAARLRLAGAYYVSLDLLEGGLQDPAVWIGALADDDPRGCLGWGDEAFAALIEAARDVPAFLAGGEEAVARLPEVAGLAATVGAARSGGAPARERLRRALFTAAEACALDAAIVVPLVHLHDASVEQGVTDLGCAAAWARPAFHGDLRRVRR